MKHLKEFTATFSAAHFYSQPLWSEEKNRAEFGRCFTPQGHGHNYRLQVSFAAEGDCSDEHMNALGAAVLRVADGLDHVHLNFVIPEFAKRVPTTENIAIYLMKQLQALNLPCPLSRLKLYETDDLWVEVTP